MRKYTKFRIDVGSLMYNYTLVILPTDLFGNGVNVHTHTLYVTIICNYDMCVLPMVVLTSRVGKEYRAVLLLLNEINKVHIWYIISINVLDKKNIRTHDIDDKYDACYPKWKAISFFEGKYDVDNGGYKLNIDLITSLNSIVLLHKDDFIHVYYIKLYSVHTDTCQFELIFHDRKYYTTKYRYLPFLRRLLDRTNEIGKFNEKMIVPIPGRGKYIRHSPYYKTVYYPDYVIHPWYPDEMMDWIYDKKDAYKWLRKRKKRIKFVGTTYERKEDINIVHSTSVVNELYQLSLSVCDIDHYVVYESIIRAKYVLVHKKFTSYNKRWIKLKKLSKNVVKELGCTLKPHEEDSIPYLYMHHGYQLKLLKDYLSTNDNRLIFMEPKELHSDVNLFKDVSLDSLIDVDKYNTWTYNTDRWLNEYYWLEIQCGSYEVIRGIIVLKLSNVVDLVYEDSYWYDIVSSGLTLKLGFARILAQEYSYYDAVSLVNISIINEVKFGPEYSSNVSITMSSLYEVESDFDIGDADILESTTMRYGDDFGIQYGNKQIYRHKWWTLADHVVPFNRGAVKVEIEYKADSIIRQLGALDTNMLVPLDNNVITELVDFSLASEYNTYKYKLLVGNWIHYVEIDEAFKRKKIRKPHLGIPLVTSRINRTLWRTKLEEIYLCEHTIMIQRRNQYKYYKAIINNNEKIINKLIYDSLRQAKMLGKYKVVEYDKDFNWIAYLNPNTYTGIKILIRAKISVLRYYMRWDEKQRFHFFEEQEKWETYMYYMDQYIEGNRIIIDGKRDLFMTTEVEQEINYEQYVEYNMFVHKERLLDVEYYIQSRKYILYEIIMTYRSAPISFRLALPSYKYMLKNKEYKPMVTVYSRSFSYFFKNKYYEYNIGYVGGSLDRLKPFKRRGISKRVKAMKKHFKLGKVVIKGYLELTKEDYTLLIRVKVRGRSFIRFYDYGCRVHYITDIIQSYRPGQRIYALYGDNND